MTTEDRIKKIIFNAESVAHLKGYEKEILPLVDFTRALVMLVKNPDLVKVFEMMEDVEEVDGILKS
jgi:hypothetical protein